MFNCVYHGLPFFSDFQPDALPAPESISVARLPDSCALSVCGHINGLVDRLLIIQGSSGSAALDIGSIIWREDRRPIGRVGYQCNTINGPIGWVGCQCNTLNGPIGRVGY